MVNPNASDRGRDAFARQRWQEAYAQLSASDPAELEPADLERLAMAAFLTGRDAESADLLAQAHQAFLNEGEPIRAARSAFWLAFSLLTRGERARAGGWVARARRLVGEAGRECVEQGYLLLPAALESVARGDIASAEATFAEAARIGERFDDCDLVSLARQGRGRALIRLGDRAGGVALLDEVMVAVTAGELSPVVAGTVYCSVIEACFEMLDMRRAGEWTEALTHWCASQPDLLPYRGQCRVRRTELMLLHGAWSDAMMEARLACEAFSQAPAPSQAGAAFYQLGELHRLRGDFAEAEEAYRLTAESGRSPQPGLALLRFAQGRLDAARAAVGRSVEEARDRRTLCCSLAASVEILLGANDVAAARDAVDRLCALAAELDTPFPRALATHSVGAVLLAEGDAGAAIVSLRAGSSLWAELDAPYEAARVRLLVAAAYRALGDEDTAQMELHNARKTLERLGAGPDLARAERHFGHPGAAAADGLTAREVEVLRLVASGRTNRAIADELAISEKTVARHLSNIFTKLDLSSRSAATAYAFRNRLV